jgi:hypothetical protein
MVLTSFVFAIPLNPRLFTADDDWNLPTPVDPHPTVSDDWDLPTAPEPSLTASDDWNSPGA